MSISCITLIRTCVLGLGLAVAASTAATAAECSNGPRAQATADAIAGHAFAKHGRIYGAATKSAMAGQISSIINNSATPTRTTQEKRDHTPMRQIYLEKLSNGKYSGRVVIYNRHTRECGTAFRPNNPVKYFNDFK